MNVAPTDTAVTLLVSPLTGTGTEMKPASESPPSWPNVLSPQHSTLPAAVRAQADPHPADTAITPLASPVTGTAAELLPPSESLPSWPVSLRPQHSTPPPAVTAHANCDPTDSAIA